MMMMMMMMMMMKQITIEEIAIVRINIENVFLAIKLQATYLLDGL